MEINQLIKHYSEIHDSKLMYIIKYEYDQLSIPAKEIALNEAEKRGLLSNNLKYLANIQDDEDIDEEVKIISIQFQKQNCPICKKNHIPNGKVLTRIYSFLLFRFKKKYLFFSCKNCMILESKRNTFINIVFSFLSPISFFFIPIEIVKIGRAHV